jgi:hypothetical protein
MLQGQVVRDFGSSAGGRSTSEVLSETPAYQGGWWDGRFQPVGTFAENDNLNDWEGADRLAYYRGYREGLRVRRMLGKA